MGLIKGAGQEGGYKFLCWSPLVEMNVWEDKYAVFLWAVNLTGVYQAQFINLKFVHCKLTGPYGA